MAEPTGYTVSYSFSGWQALNPSKPLPAAEVDIQFEGIETSLTSVIAALAEVRRSDGGLENGVVTYDSLNDQIKKLVGGSDRGIVLSDIDPDALADQADAEAGEANDKLMTALRTAQAIVAQRPYTLQADAQAGTEDDTVMSPARVTDALDALRAFASLAEAQAGTVTAKVSSPARVKDALDALRTKFFASASLTWAELLAGASATQNVTVTGAAVNDRVLVGLPSGGLPEGVVWIAWVASANTVTIRLTNTTAGSLTPTAAQIYSVTTLRF